MADAATTKRGLNALLTTKDEQGGRDMPLPTTPNNEQAQVWPDFSTASLFLDATRAETTKKLLESARKVGSFSLADDSWHPVDWDPEVGCIDFWVYSSGTDGVEITTAPAGAANAGAEVPNGAMRSIYVGDSPIGRLYIRRTNAGNSGNGSTTVKVNYFTHGSRRMLGATNLAANVAHS